MASLPDDLQITAEQIILEAFQRQEKKPVLGKSEADNIKDLQELKAYQRRKRNEYEGYLSRSRFNFGQWIRYAEFEVQQNDLDRARSVLERALEVDNKAVNVWLRYINIEIKAKNINHARNLLERATNLLPKVDKFWYQYVLIEENLNNIIGVRLIYNKWLTWKPSLEVWKNFIDFEIRYKEFNNVRLIFEKLVIIKPESSTWLMWIEFEKEYNDSIDVLNTFKLAIDSLSHLNKLDHQILISYLRFQINQRNQLNQINQIYDYCINKLANSVEEIKLFNTKFANLQRQIGGSTLDIEKSIINKRISQYEDELVANPTDYYKWWIYLELLIKKQHNSIEFIRSKFDIAINSSSLDIPKDQLVKLVYIYIKYITWEELQKKHNDSSQDRIRSLYNKVTKLIISTFKITKMKFTRIWISFCEFEMRIDKEKGILQARKVLGKCIGNFKESCEDILIYYIQFEKKLREFDRVRILFNKLLELYPYNYKNWLYFSYFEMSLNEYQRSKEILELLYLNNNQLLNEFSQLNDRETVVQFHIEICLNLMEYQKARELFDKLCQVLQTPAIIIKRCYFELQIPNDDQLEKIKQNANQDTNDELEIEIEINSESITRVLKTFKSFETNDMLNNEGRFLLYQAYTQFTQKYKSLIAKDNMYELKKPNIKHKTKLVDGVNVEYIDYEF